MVTDLVNSLANALPDAAILGVSATLFGLFGGGIALTTNRLWFRHWTYHSAYEDKLADTAHSSLLGFSAFVLALLITNGVSSLSKTDDMVRQEATNIYRLNRELATLGPAANDARQTLAIYARNVADDEWPRLATLPNALSPLAQKNLTISGASSASFSAGWICQVLLEANLQETWRRSKTCGRRASRPRRPTFRRSSGSSYCSSSPLRHSSAAGTRRSALACRLI